MAEHPPKLLSHVIADWACALKYEDLSPAAIEAAKLFWSDSIGCALAGRARIGIAPRDIERICGASRRRTRAQSNTRTNGLRYRHQRVANILPGSGDSGQVNQHEEHGRPVGGTHGRRERASRSRRFL